MTPAEARAQFESMSPEDAERVAAAQARMQATTHAVQSGVAMEMNYGDAGTTPKHLRVGVNVALALTSALGRLLIGKGIMTWPEYFEAMADGLEEEKTRYEEALEERLGTKITLA